MAAEAHHRHLADEVRQLRRERGWTLDVAAEQLGISRRLLAQLEAATANPSLSTLLAVAAGFEVPLADLLAPPPPTVITVAADRSQAPVLWAGPSGGEGRLLVASGDLELWSWRLEPGEERRSDAHRRGAREALTVTAGTLTIEAGGEAVTVGPGRSAAFPAGVAHRYANPTGRPVRFLLAVHEPAVAAGP